MNKIIILVPVIFFLSFKPNDSQSYFVNYLMVYKLNLEEAEDPAIPEEFRATFKKYLIEESKMKTYFTLEHIESKSKYQFDRVENQPEKTETAYVDFYKDFSKKEIYITGGVIGDAAIKETFPKWIYQKDTSNILGYNCYKAVLVEKNDTITAWYTLDIPIFDGPEHYAGLPGLILKYETRRKTVIATDITKIKNDDLIVELPEFINFISEEKFKNNIQPKN